MIAELHLEDPVNALRDIEISFNEMLHVDKVEGYVQIQIVAPTMQIGCSPAERINQVIERELWAEFLMMASQQSDEWLVNIADLMADQEQCPIHRILALIDIAESAEAKADIYMSIPNPNYGAQTVWAADEIRLVPSLIQTFQALCVQQDTGRNSEISIYQQIVKQLEKI